MADCVGDAGGYGVGRPGSGSVRGVDLEGKCSGSGLDWTEIRT